MGNFQKYWSQNVGQDFIVLDFFVGGDRAGGKGVCGRLMSPAQEAQSMREIRLLRGRLPRKGGGLTGMDVSLFLVILIYLLVLNRPKDISVSLTIYLFWYAFWVIVSNTLKVKEILKIHVFLIGQKIYPCHSDKWYISITVIYHAMSLIVLYLYNNSDV